MAVKIAEALVNGLASGLHAGLHLIPVIGAPLSGVIGLLI